MTNSEIFRDLNKQQERINEIENKTTEDIHRYWKSLEIFSKRFKKQKWHLKGKKYWITENELFWLIQADENFREKIVEAIKERSEVKCLKNTKKF